MYWYEEKSTSPSAVLSTRVRFARSLEGIPFPHRASPEERRTVYEKVLEAFSGTGMMEVSFDRAEEAVREAYIQTRLASRELGQTGPHAGLLIAADGKGAVMINEEDHLRIQVIRKGKALREAFSEAKALCRKAEEKLFFAYRDGLGYLNACPTNLGEGMRLSVMIHLPALSASGKMDALIRRISDSGFTVRGIFGEKSREAGGIYQISNQCSREKTGEEILRSFEKAVEAVEEAEKAATAGLLSRDRLFWEDRVSRALGTLKYAKKMNYGEFVELYSTVRFGASANLGEAPDPDLLDRLFVELQRGPLVLRDRSLADERERDRRRSEILRERLE
ncbi:MAG: hypothetical protein IKD31_00855 [Clostridia bacterium]|nr:hypothetical protein [Clostridia bacterium]